MTKEHINTCISQRYDVQTSCYCQCKCAEIPDVDVFLWQSSSVCLALWIIKKAKKLHKVFFYCFSLRQVFVFCLSLYLSFVSFGIHVCEVVFICFFCFLFVFLSDFPNCFSIYTFLSFPDRQKVFISSKFIHFCLNPTGSIAAFLDQTKLNTFCLDTDRVHEKGSFKYVLN